MQKLKTTINKIIYFNDNHLIHQLMFWFYGNLQVFSISIGYVGPENGLSFMNSILAETAGLIFGTIFMALHAIQGPITKLSQMVQSRYQFGNYGSILPSVAAIIMFLSFAIINCVFISDAIYRIFGINKSVSIIAALIISYGVSFLGHNNIIKIFKILTYASLPMLVLFSVYVFVHHFVEIEQPHLTLIGFIITFSVAASFNITFAPYVSDYTREIPQKHGSVSIGSSVFFGALISALWLSILGSWLSVHGYSHNPLFDIYSLGNRMVNNFGMLLFIVFSVSLIGNIAINIYSCSLTMMTSMQSLKITNELSFLNNNKVYLFFLVCLLSAVVTSIDDSPVVSLVTTLLTLLLFLLAPWTGINLVDFYYRKKIGITHNVKVENFIWPGIFSYLLGISVSFMFINNPPIIVGPFSKFDIFSQLGWLIGLALSSISFYFFLVLKHQWRYHYEKQN